jgi:hypothetical protein
MTGKNSLWRHGKPAAKGIALAELLLSLPFLGVLGLGGLQVTLVLLWRQQLIYTVEQGARAGSVAHADPEAITAGLGRGLAPLLFGATDAVSQQQAQAQGVVHMQIAQAAGWAQWRQLAPTAASFSDWAVPAIDATGQAIPGVSEIPIDSMAVRARFQAPASGQSGQRGHEPIGAASGQTLADASVLKIELTYWVPLQVPWVGTLAARIAQAASGCSAQCGQYFAADFNGRPIARWPVRVASTQRMLTAPRQAGDALAGAPMAGPPLGTGDVDAASSFTPVAVSALNPDGVTESNERVHASQPGFLQMGGQAWPTPKASTPGFSVPSPGGGASGGVGSSIGAGLGLVQPGVCAPGRPQPGPFSGLGR